MYAGTVVPITLEDAFGAVDFFLLPFLKPASVRRFYPEEDIPTTSAAIACAIAHMPIDPSRRNVLLAHQFVAGGQLCDEEEFAVGDADNVSPEAFAPFDYVAVSYTHLDVYKRQRDSRAIWAIGTRPSRDTCPHG